MTDDDIGLLNHLSRESRIVALNKTDLPIRLEPGSILAEPLSISALTGEGFDRLTETIFARLAGDTATERDDIMLTDARQHAAVQSAIGQLRDASELIMTGELEEIVLLRLRGALSSLGEITGETLTDDILGEIFSTFCIGK